MLLLEFWHSLLASTLAFILAFSTIAAELRTLLEKNIDLLRSLIGGWIGTDWRPVHVSEET